MRDTSSLVNPYTITIAACVTAITALIPVTLFQVGTIARLPDPPLPFFDSARITSSKTAHPLGVPDGMLGLASYGVTLTLVLSSHCMRSARPVLRGKLLLDGSAACINSVRQLWEFKRACSWCLLTAAATAVMVRAGWKFLDQ